MQHFQGQKNSSLSKKGEYQAEMVGRALNQCLLSKIYASDLDRAFNTAKIIALNNQMPASPASDQNHNIVETNELLRERCFGIFELRPHKEFVTAAEKAGFVKGENLYDFIPEGGEGCLGVRKRAVMFLDYIVQSVTAEKLSEKNSLAEPYNIVVVSHSGFLRQMASYLIKDCKSKLPSEFKQHLGEDERFLEKAVKNTAISSFNVQIDLDTNELVSVECIKYACTKHLEEEE